MDIQHTNRLFQTKQGLSLIFVACIVLLICATVMVDYSYSVFHNSSFYISESLLFSSYWLLFLPSLTIFFKLSKTLRNKILLVISLSFFHLFSYAALVWVISKVFYEHTFEFWQTLNFGLSAYFILSAIIYGFLVFACSFINKRRQTLQNGNEIDENTNRTTVFSSIIVSDNHKKLPLQVDDIFYVSADSPYINIYHASKKYIHTETLKSLEAQFDNKKFVRIHKSHIVNISKITSVQSRQNGDFDVTLSNNTILRVSRNYAKNFKLRFEQHHLITK